MKHLVIATKWNLSFLYTDNVQIVFTLGIVFGMGIFFSPMIAKVMIVFVAAIHFYVLIFRIKSVEQTA